MTKVEDNLFFRDFSAAGQDALLRCATTENYAHGVEIFKEGDASDGLRLILEGDVEIIKSAGLRQQTLTHYHAGDYFGEISVLDGGGRSTAARAVGAVTLARIPREEFLEVLKKEPVELSLNIFRRVLEALRLTNELFVREVVHKEKLSLVGEMAGSLMHDMRNPLTGIGLASDTIMLQHDDASTTKNCDAIRLQCDRVVAMAQELLEFSRDETRLQLSTTTTTAFLEQFCALNEDFFAQTDVAIDARAEPADIRVDSMRLLRLLQNLVSNAIDALAGQPKARIDIAAWTQAGILHLTVADNGPGLSENVEAHLFEPFVTEGKAKGTGLGLSIVRNIVVAHGGKIDVRTAPGQGTTFNIQLPQHSKTQQLPLLPTR
jgi:signal transduction histidine kinase